VDLKGFARTLLGPSFAVAIAAAAALAPSTATARPQLPLATELGPTAASETITVSLVLKVKHPELLENFVALTQEPGLPTYHKFLSVKEFTDLFAPSQAEIAIIKKYLAGFGITVDEVYADRLIIKATGTADAFDQAFQVQMTDVRHNGRRFHRAHRPPVIPLLLRDLLVSVQGFDSQPLFRHHHVDTLSNSPLTAKPPVLPKAGAVATGVPGSFTVGDVANLYNVNPLYQAGFDGTGRTVGIVTLANFDPADAFSYWNLIGLSVNPNRLTQVHVDGGGELSADAGTGETCLDVEQSGGLAPGAKMVVYDAPNTDAGFDDLFYKAASDNLVDTMSVSWGLSEAFFYEQVVGEDRTPLFTAFHQAFLQAAAQGISVFAAAGDSGAFDINDAFNDPVTNVLTVDHPAADPAITAAGGTTVPLTLHAGPPEAPDLVVTKEQVWGWDYAENYLVQVLGPQFEHALFPTGGGGGVSTFFKAPKYQNGTQGIRKTEPNQSIIFDDGTGPVDLMDLPARFAGRNLPDVSLNADPFSGYLLVSTPDGGLLSGFGGTSFVAPQLNGITAVVSQAAGSKRLGLINPMLYRFKKSTKGAKAALVDVTAGDNWFYAGVAGYNPGSGLGVLNVANFAAAVNKERGGH
jgi:subtilase family serine protease